MKCAAIILVGGKSERMGRSKASLEFAGEPLIVHMVRKLEGLFGEIVVVAAPDQKLPELPVTMVRDEIAHQGPVGGIYYGLRESTHTASFVTSCDVPFLSPALVTHLVACISDWDVVVPYWQGRFQPLHAVYRRSVLPLLRQQLDEGRLRPVYLYEKVRTRKVQEDEVLRVDPDGSSFINMNTLEDYESALMRWGTESPRAGWIAAGHCQVELFGVARLRAQTARVDIALNGSATLAEVLAALAVKLPVLVGPVIAPEGDRLVAGNACNVNGREFVKNPNFTVRPDDHVLIVSSDAGG